MLKFIKYEYSTDKHRYNTYECHCGKQFIRRQRKEALSPTAHCGCTHSQLKHGHEIGRKKTPELRAWCKLKARCDDPNDKAYKYYGERGITYAKEWGEFIQFYADMGPRPSNKHFIDRIDVNGNYCKENCRWASAEDQANNKTNSVKIEINGVSKGITQWARDLGIKRHGYYKNKDKFLELLKQKVEEKYGKESTKSTT